VGSEQLYKQYMTRFVDESSCYLGFVFHIQAGFSAVVCGVMKSREQHTPNYFQSHSKILADISENTVE
jgi:hypothetical protein